MGSDPLDKFRRPAKNTAATTIANTQGQHDAAARPKNSLRLSSDMPRNPNRNLNIRGTDNDDNGAEDLRRDTRSRKRLPGSSALDVDTDEGKRRSKRNKVTESPAVLNALGDNFQGARKVEDPFRRTSRAPQTKMQIKTELPSSGDEEPSDPGQESVTAGAIKGKPKGGNNRQPAEPQDLVTSTGKPGMRRAIGKKSATAPRRSSKHTLAALPDRSPAEDDNISDEIAVAQPGPLPLAVQADSPMEDETPHADVGGDYMPADVAAGRDRLLEAVEAVPDEDSVPDRLSNAEAPVFGDDSSNTDDDARETSLQHKDMTTTVKDPQATTNKLTDQEDELEAQLALERGIADGTVSFQLVTAERKIAEQAEELSQADKTIAKLEKTIKRLKQRRGKHLTLARELCGSLETDDETTNQDEADDGDTMI